MLFNKELKSLKEENKRLKEENQRLKFMESYYLDLIDQCEKLKEKWKSSIFEAKKAQTNFEIIYKSLKTNGGVKIERN